METKQYAGLDYSGPGSSTNRDVETGIRYGVISQHSVMPEALDDIMTHGEDLAWAAAIAQALAEAKMESKDGEVDEDRITDDLAMDWESSFNDYMYERDGYKLTGCLANDLFVLKAPFYTFAQFCSPCVPGAGNLDHPFEPHPNQMSADEIITLAIASGFPKVYCLGHDWFDGVAPYPVLRVSDDSIVEPLPH